MATWCNSYNNNYFECRNYNLTRVSQDLKKGLFLTLFLKDGVTDFISEACASSHSFARLVCFIFFFEWVDK